MMDVWWLALVFGDVAERSEAKQTASAMRNIA
jgi:hypothetical protein